MCWVELARLADPALVAQTVAKALNVVEQPDMPAMDALLEGMRTKDLLLVLDNCEHVLAACAQLVESLLRHASVKILTTSREPLGVEGEMLYRVPSLTLLAELRAVAEASQYDAVRLFFARAEHAPRFWSHAGERKRHR